MHSIMHAQARRQSGVTLLLVQLARAHRKQSICRSSSRVTPSRENRPPCTTSTLPFRQKFWSSELGYARAPEPVDLPQLIQGDAVAREQAAVHDQHLPV